MTAIALIIAAFIQLETQKLSLLDGIVVSLVRDPLLSHMHLTQARTIDYNHDDHLRHRF